MNLDCDRCPGAVLSNRQLPVQKFDISNFSTVSIAVDQYVADFNFPERDDHLSKAHFYHMGQVP